MSLPGTYLEVDGSAVSASDALSAWVVYARPALERSARTYHATITYKELAETVQTESGVRTRRLLQHWIGDVLGTVARECHAKGEPLLSALCVRSDGTVRPDTGVAVVENFGGEPPEDLDMHAANERFRCYQYFGASMPPDGGRPALTRQVVAARQRAQRQTSRVNRRVRFVQRVT